MGKKAKAASGTAGGGADTQSPDNNLTSFPALGASLTPSSSRVQSTAAAAAPAQSGAPAWGRGIHRAAAGGSTQPPAASREGCEAAQLSPVQRSAAASAPPCVYQVNGSRKGGFPVQLESRKNGKKVTVIRNVTGTWCDGFPGGGILRRRSSPWRLPGTKRVSPGKSSWVGLHVSNFSLSLSLPLQFRSC